METEILIDGKKVKFRATAAVPRLYRIKFRRDIIQDMKVVQKALERKDRDAENIPPEALQLFEDMSYIMAKHADASVPSTIEDWLDGFEMFDIYQVLPEILGLWGLNEQTTVESKKKLEKVAGR